MLTGTILFLIDTYWPLVKLTTITKQILLNYKEVLNSLRCREIFATNKRERKKRVMIISSFAECLPPLSYDDEW